MIESHGYKIFNDHFDPILFFPAVLKIFLPLNWTIFLTEIFFIVLATYPIFLLARDKAIDSRVGYFLVLYLLFNQPTLAAVYFPIHPTTWAVAPISFLLYGLFKKNHSTVLISTIFLMSCKEEFPFTAIFVSLWLIYDTWKNKRHYWVVFTISIISIVWFLFALKFRKMIFGGAYFDYGSIFVRNLYLEPFGFVREYGNWTWDFLARAFIPLLLILAFRKLNLRKLYWPSLFIAIPMISLRVLTGKFGYHYSAVMMIPIVFFFLDADFTISRFQFILACLVLVITSWQKIENEITSLAYSPTSKECPINKTRLEDMKQVISYDYSNCSRLITSGGVSFVLSSNGIYSRSANLNRVLDMPPLANAKKVCYLFDRGYNYHPRSKMEILEYSKYFKTIFRNENFILLN